MSKFVLVAVAIVLLACLNKAVNATEDKGVLERAKETYRELKTKVVDAGSTVVDLIHMYYVDEVKPLTEPYTDWAKEKARSFWDRIREKLPLQRFKLKSENVTNTRRT